MNDEGLQEEEEGTYNRQDFWVITSKKTAQLRAEHPHHPPGGMAIPPSSCIDALL